MVNLIIEQNKGFKSAIDLMTIAFDGDYDEHDTFEIITQEWTSGQTHSYFLYGDWTVKVKDSKIFLISDRISSVIDMKNEVPTDIRTERI